MSGVLDLRPVVPALIVAVTGIVVLLARAFTPKGQPAPYVGLSLGGLLAAFWASVQILQSPAHGFGSSTGGAVAADAFALYFHGLILAIAALAVLLSAGYLRTIETDAGEYYALLLFAVVGMLGLTSCIDLISVFVALEIMSVALYAMAGMRRDQPESQESALKYFLTGAFASSFLLYGVALLYGVSGSTLLPQISTALAAGGSERGLATLGAGLLLVGFGFKIASVPFHMWAPDVYEGAPTTVTAFMAAGVKTAAFGALLRVFGQGLVPLAHEWQPAVAILALLSMVLGNLGALAQTNLKRMLAYSSIAHAGYLLTAMTAVPSHAAEAVLFYLAAYGAVNLGGFGALAALAKSGREPLSLDDVAGLGRRRPSLAFALTVFLISLTGVPVSAGFVGKFYLFRAAVESGHAGLAIVGMLMSVVSAYYYLRVVVAMYMREPVGEEAWAPVPVTAGLALAAACSLILWLGILPGPLLAAARAAAAVLR